MMKFIFFNFLVFGLLLFDLGVLHKREHTIPVKEALGLSLFYMILAFSFNLGVYYWAGPEAGTQFLTGYFIEKSLSLDNIFVFVLIFKHFNVPTRYQHRVLFWGILGALLMRSLLIYLGSSLIQQFHSIIFVFGAFLILSGLKMLWANDEHSNLENNRVLLFLHRHLPLTETFYRKHFYIRKEGKFFFTPLFIVLIFIEMTDLIFAVDSIPAIFAITLDPFIVYTSNVFAILGLRALYFALAGIIDRFHMLKYGLSLTLVLIGGKMILNGIYGEKFIPTEIALLLTAILIFGSLGLSLLMPHKASSGPLSSSRK